MDAFLGMITAFGFNFAPRGWMACSGQLLAMQQNSALFSLLGITYGGNGIQTFALPNLQGRVAIGQGQGPGLSHYVLGQMTGVENVTLNTTNIPQHSHLASSSVATAPQGAIVAGDSSTPENNYLALSPKIGSGPNATILKTYATPTAAAAEASKIKPIAGNTANTVTTTNGVTGGNSPVSILQPSLALSYCICLQGIFPSRN